ncbi:MAG: hypothetical protein ACJ75J_11240 [Cytophagaceae bacterium]
MKKCLLVLAIFLTACSGEKKSRIISKSPDGGPQLIVSATKENFAEPWLTSFMVKGGDSLLAPTTQVFSEDISPDFVRFKWKSKSEVLVEFLQTDDSKRIFNLKIRNKQVEISELNTIPDEDDDWETGLKVK